MKKFVAKYAAKAVSAALIIAMLAGCGNTAGNNSNESESNSPANTSEAVSEQAPEESNADIRGNVKLAEYGWNEGYDITEAYVRAFNEEFPNINVEIEYFASNNMSEYLTTSAAAQTMPDVFLSWDSLTFFISQGWVAPIQEFYDSDPDAAYVPSVLTEPYRIGGNLYAAPFDLQFNSIMVNLDLLETLNEDAPPYDWTIDEFVRLCKKATTDKLSGINHLWAFEEAMIGMYDRSLGQYGYSPSLKKFVLNNGAWVNAVNLKKELNSIAGLVSDNLKDQAKLDAGELDDYSKKFGKDADALRESKILFGFHGTWDVSWIKTMGYRWDFYPLPSTSPDNYTQAVHANYACVTSTAQDKRAAYEVMKYMSFSPEGTNARLEVTANYVTPEGVADPYYGIPSTIHPDVLDKFNAYDMVPNGIKYMLENLDKGFMNDSYKTVPDFSNIVDTVIRPKSDDVVSGTADAAAVAAEVDQLANTAVADSWKAFEDSLKK